MRATDDATTDTEKHRGGENQAIRSRRRTNLSRLRYRASYRRMAGPGKREHRAPKKLECAIRNAGEEQKYDTITSEGVVLLLKATDAMEMSDRRRRGSARIVVIAVSQLLPVAPYGYTPRYPPVDR